MPDDLPSVRFERDDPRPKGFVEEVSEAHLQAVGRALKALADAVQLASADSEAKLRVRFTNVRYMPTLPFVLYAFHLMQVDDSGKIVDETDSGGDITYALVANHAVEVQRESALLFLYQLVSRQEAIGRMRSAGDPEIHRIDTVTMEADQRAKQAKRRAIDRPAGPRLWADSRSSLRSRPAAHPTRRRASHARPARCLQ